MIEYLTKQKRIIYSTNNSETVFAILTDSEHECEIPAKFRQNLATFQQNLGKFRNLKRQNLKQKSP